MIVEITSIQILRTLAVYMKLRPFQKGEKTIGVKRVRSGMALSLRNCTKQNRARFNNSRTILIHLVLQLTSFCFFL